MQILILSIFLFSSYAVANDEYLSERLEREIKKSDFSTIDELAENERVIRDLSLREQYFKEREKPWSPIPFRALLIKGTRLVDVKTGKVYFTSSDMYVYAQEETIGSQITYILNQEKEAKYKTFTKNLRSIERDIALYPEVDVNKSYLEKPKYHSTDKTLEIESHMTFHIETMKSIFFADLYNGTETLSTANRFQSKTFFNSVLPVDFGFSLGFQEGLWNDTDNQVKWSTGYFGPSLRWQFAKWGKARFNTKLGVERSFRFTAIGTSSRATFSSLTYDFELEAVYNSAIGPFLFGWTLRNMTWQLEDTDTPLNIINNKKEITSTSIFAGYRVDFDF
ncbi:MAG: hypothetical protein CME70_21200 [Halobacteriovorax sp.]|nr:hypothetical protein [Halobacteriovorax sp.]|tara:strand:+ start:93842 stop:94849 length:1008 start_codon:yes stop_codon:yes gene_type:complete